MQEIEAGKPGADHGDVDLLSGSALLGGTCGNHGIRHRISSRMFVCRQAIAAGSACHQSKCNLR
jgi:hypothetical protein